MSVNFIPGGIINTKAKIDLSCIPSSFKGIQSNLIFFYILLIFPLTFGAFFNIIQSSTKTIDKMDYLVL